MTLHISIPLISKLIEERNFVLHSWNDTISGGVWCCCLRFDIQCKALQDASEDVPFEDEMFELDSVYEYLLNQKANWLPIVIAPNLIKAIAALEARLEALPPDFLSAESNWSYATFQTIEHIRTVDGKYKLLPIDFNEVNANYFKID